MDNNGTAVPYGYAYRVEHAATRKYLFAGAELMLDNARDDLHEADKLLHELLVAEEHAPRTKAGVPYKSNRRVREAREHLGWFMDPDRIGAAWIISNLPVTFTGRYTVSFLHHFVDSLKLVAWKLGQAEPLPMSCTAEEIALYLIADAGIEHARLMSEEDPTIPVDEIARGMNYLYDNALQDMDFMGLYNMGAPDLREPALAPAYGTDPDHLDLDGWFTPFRVETGVPLAHIFRGPHADD